MPSDIVCGASAPKHSTDFECYSQLQFRAPGGSNTLRLVTRMPAGGSLLEASDGTRTQDLRQGSAQIRTA